MKNVTEEEKELGKIIIGLAERISKLEKKLIDVGKWAETRQYDSVKKLYDILDRK